MQYFIAFWSCWEWRPAVRQTNAKDWDPDDEDDDACWQDDEEDARNQKELGEDDASETETWAWWVDEWWVGAVEGGTGVAVAAAVDDDVGAVEPDSAAAVAEKLDPS